MLEALIATRPESEHKTYQILKIVHDTMVAEVLFLGSKYLPLTKAASIRNQYKNYNTRRDSVTRFKFTYIFLYQVKGFTTIVANFR